MTDLSLQDIQFPQLPQRQGPRRICHVDAKDDDSWNTREIGKLEKDLDARRAEIVGQLKATAYFERQAHWLISRFPDAKLVDVPGLVKLVDHQEIAAADWSLTPGRYVGVAPAEVDDDFDFEQPSAKSTSKSRTSTRKPSGW